MALKILVVAAHPDDESIGMGGTIRMFVNQGHEVVTWFMTRGELGCPGQNTDETALLRIHEAFEAADVLGSKVVGYWEEPDGSLELSDRTVNDMAKIIAIQRPDKVFCPHGIDGHHDHMVANQIVKAAFEKGFLKPEVWQYEIWTPMASYDNANDITDFIGIKLRAIRRHESQVNRIRFDEAALCLARFRGELHNRPAGPYAEVFKRLD